MVAEIENRMDERRVDGGTNTATEMTTTTRDNKKKCNLYWAREMEESNKGERRRGEATVQYKESRVRSRTKKTHSSCQEQPLHPF